jgi:hypothetical protein
MFKGVYKMKFNIGDKVVLKKNLHNKVYREYISHPDSTTQEIRTLSFLKKYRKFFGKIGIVTELYNGIYGVYFDTSKVTALGSWLKSVKPIKKIKDTPKETKPEYKITIGSDPELSFSVGNTQNNLLFPAKWFINTSTSTQLGCDGCADLAELRPPYGNNPLEHTENIRKILRRLNNKVELLNKGNDLLRYFPADTLNSLGERNVITLAGNGFLKSTGGHIHFNIPLGDENKKFLLLLDIMSIFLNSMEVREDSVRRRAGNYGQLSAYETKSYGFEYRTLASWLYSQNNARNILCLSYVLAYEWMNNKDFCEQIIALFLKEFPNYGIAFQSANSLYFIREKINLFEIFKKKVRKMIKYPEYKPYIENLFSFQKLGKKFKEHEDLLSQWDFSIDEKKATDFYYFNEKDYFMKEIKEMVTNEKTEGENIFIYGINQKKDYDLATNNDYIYNLLTHYSMKFSKNYKITKMRNFDFDSIGFGYKLRAVNRNEIVTILEQIRGNLEREYIKKPFISDNTDYETKMAQTDTERDIESRGIEVLSTPEGESPIPRLMREYLETTLATTDTRGSW